MNGLVLSEKDVLAAVHKSPAIGLMCDQSTDTCISTTKELILYVCILSCGKVDAHFLKLIHIKGGEGRGHAQNHHVSLYISAIPMQCR